MREDGISERTDCSRGKNRNREGSVRLEIEVSMHFLVSDEQDKPKPKLVCGQVSSRTDGPSYRDSDSRRPADRHLFDASKEG